VTLPLSSPLSRVIVLGTVGFLVTLGMILLLVVGISSLQGWHNGLLDNLDTRTTRLYVRAPRKSVASVLSKAAFFMNLPKWKDQESSNDIIDVALIEDAEGCRFEQIQ
jgi:hypothetical protein